MTSSRNVNVIAVLADEITIIFVETNSRRKSDHMPLQENLDDQSVISKLGDEAKTKLSQVDAELALAFQIHILDAGLTNHKTRTQIRSNIEGLLSDITKGREVGQE